MGSSNGLTYTSNDEERDVSQSIAEANARLHTPDYVEARAILQPSTEYFSAAVRHAEQQGILDGGLLSLVRQHLLPGPRNTVRVEWYD